MILADVEFLQEGQAALHKEHAGEPQQQAKLPRDRIAPIFSYLMFSSIFWVMLPSLLVKCNKWIIRHFLEYVIPPHVLL